MEIPGSEVWTASLNERVYVRTYI